MILNRKFDKFGIRIETESLHQGKQVVTINSDTVSLGEDIRNSTVIDDNFSKYHIRFPSNLTMNLNTTVIWEPSEAKKIIVCIKNTHCNNI